MTSRPADGPEPKRTQAPSMPGPAGAAPQSTESIGDPDAGDPTASTEGGAATGAVLGTLVAGPIGLAAGAVAGALAGSAAGTDEALEGGHRADDGRPARTSAETQRGAGAPGPTTADDDLPVVDALTEMTTGDPSTDRRHRA